MNDFITYDIRSGLSKEQVFDQVVRALPMFNWRRGDGDAQGPNISGANDDLIQVKLWLGEAPIRMSVSFRRAWLDASDRENRKRDFVDVIRNTLLPSLGTVLKMDV